MLYFSKLRITFVSLISIFFILITSFNFFKFENDLLNKKINLGLDKNITFTKIKINESSSFSEIIVVGTPEMIESKINTSTKKLLRG